MANPTKDRVPMPPPMSTKPTSQTGSSAFSNPTKMEVVRLAGPNCWACNTPDPQFAHVFAQQDTQKQVWEDCNLINFSYSSAANSIPLCSVCHGQYDNSLDTGYVFFPADLDFFIEYELHDRQRRRQGPRKTPSAADYKDHQVREGKVSSLAPGGLYCRIFLKDFLLGGILAIETLRMLALDKPWHGNPIASLRRAFGILGSVRIEALDPNICHQLHRLRHLYFSDSANSRLTLIYRFKAPEKRSRDDSDDEEDMQRKRRGSLQDSTRNCDDTHVHQSADTSQKIPARDPRHASRSPGTSQACDWVLGPHFSTNEAIERLAPVFSYPNIIQILSA